jgi:hypothetical protein
MLSMPSLRLPAVARPRIVSSAPTRLLKACPDATLSLFSARHVATVSPYSRLVTPSPTSSPSSCPRLHPTLAVPRLQARGKTTKTTVNLEDLPQGAIPSAPLPAEEDHGPAYPTVILQARRNMQKFDNCILLTRVGGFYEMYFEHAQEYGPLLNLKVVPKRTSAGPVPMVPHHSLFCVPSNLPYFVLTCIVFSRLLFILLKSTMYWYLSIKNPALMGCLGWVSLLSAGSLPQDPSSRSQSLCCYLRGVPQ